MKNSKTESLLHFAVCQRLRCPLLSKVQIVTKLFLQICSTSLAVELLLFVDTHQALLADQLGSSGMAAGFGKLSTKKHHKNLKNHVNMKKYCDFIF